MPLKPKLFWKTLDNLKDKSSDKSSSPIKMSKWYDYLSELYSEKNEDMNLHNIEENFQNSIRLCI